MRKDDQEWNGMKMFDCPPEGAKTDCAEYYRKAECIQQIRTRHYDRTKIAEVPIIADPARMLRLKATQNIIDADRNQEIAIQTRYSLRSERWTSLSFAGQSAPVSQLW
jgi:hypothetical protein